MRFSTLFQQDPPPRPPRREEQPRSESCEPPPAAPDLPDDLDARVRLIGEWQLGEG